MDTPDIQRLRHMLLYCQDIEDTVRRFGDDLEIFVRDKDYYRSVTMCILQIGELAGGFSEEFRENTAEKMPWAEMRGMRNVMAHRYFTVQKERVWRTAREDIPALQRFCEEILEQEGHD